MNSLFILLGHMISIPQVIKSRVMLGVQANGFQVELNSFYELPLVAVSVTQVVETFYFFRVYF